MPENQISPEGKADAEAELEQRTKVRRPEIVAAIKVAREFGDLKENAEYHAAREEQGHNEARIRVLEHHLASAVVAEREDSGGTVVAGSKVTYQQSGGKKASEVTIVHPLEADVSSGKVSAESPIGLALLGGAKGDKVELVTARGTKQLEILDVA
jgi:transcription elongation factor GreA